MKKLYICGDSYSLSNDGLNWGELISQKLNMDLIHTGKRGISNYAIFFRTLFDNFKVDDERICIIGWSFPDRQDYWNHKNFVKQCGLHYESLTDPDRPMGFYETLSEKANDDLAKKLFKLKLMVNLANEPLYIDTINYLISLDGFLTSRNIKHLFVFANAWVYNFNSSFKPLDTMMSYMRSIPTLVDPTEYGYIDDAIANNFDHYPTNHLYPDGHEYVSDRLIERLIQFKII